MARNGSAPVLAARAASALPLITGTSSAGLFLMLSSNLMTSSDRGSRPYFFGVVALSDLNRMSKSVPSGL